MPNKINISMPPILTGDADQKIQSLYNWIFQLAEQLNVALNSIDEMNLAEPVVTMLNGAATQANLTKAISDQNMQIRLGSDRITQMVSNEISAVRNDMEASDRKLRENLEDTDISLRTAISDQNTRLTKKIKATETSANERMDQIAGEIRSDMADQIQEAVDAINERINILHPDTPV